MTAEFWCKYDSVLRGGGSLPLLLSGIVWQEMRKKRDQRKGENKRVGKSGTQGKESEQKKKWASKSTRLPK
jgi:hypothetical protein